MWCKYFVLFMCSIEMLLVRGFNNIMGFKLYLFILWGSICWNNNNNRKKDCVGVIN